MLSSNISYWDLIKFPYFADITESRDRGWKHAQRQGDFMDNSNKEKKNHPLVDFRPRQQFLHVLQTRCVCSTYYINYSSQQIYTKSRIPPYHIKLAAVTYSTWLQQSGWFSWDGLKNTCHNFQFYDHTSQLFKNLEFVSLPLTPPLNRLPVQPI